MKLEYIYIIIIIVCWSINPFIKKIINKKIYAIEYNFYNNLCIMFMLLIVFAYNIFSKNNKFEINMFKKLDLKELGLLVISSCLTLIPSYLFVNIIKTQSVSQTNSVIQSSTILVSSLIGIYFFNDPYTIKKVIGIGNIIVGLYFIM